MLPAGCFFTFSSMPAISPRLAGVAPNSVCMRFAACSSRKPWSIAVSAWRDGSMRSSTVGGAPKNSRPLASPKPLGMRTAPTRRPRRTRSVASAADVRSTSKPSRFASASTNAFDAGV